jgi:hypothetical protein
MAKYREIKGVTVQTRDTDPTVNAGVWASAPSLNATIREGGGSGTSTSAINVGGYPYPMTAEQWNGSTWATFTNLGTQRGKNATAGTYTNGIVGNGSTPGTPGIGILNLIESWNGSAWSEITEINSIRDSNAMSAGGTSTAVIYFGGNASPGVQALNEEWDGSTWSEESDLNTARSYLVGMGTTTAALGVGGSTNTAVESWNGSSWSETTEVNTGRHHAAGSSVSSTDGLVFGGDSQIANTESWNGSAWTEVNDLATGRDHLKGAGPSSTAALAFGGLTPSVTSATEEWSFPSGPHLNEGDIFLSAGATLKGFSKNVSSGTFSSGGNLNSEHLDAAAGGATQSSFMIIAGYPNLTIVEQYDGSSWTEVGDVNVTRQLGGASAQAPAPTMLFFGGNPAPGRKLTELYDGSSWSEKGDLNTNREYSGGGAGTSTSALCVGGYGSPAAYLANNESWDGTSWTEVGDLNVARYGGATGGTQDSARCVAGAPPTNPPAAGDKNEGWDGTTWTEATENSDNSAARAGFGANKDFFMVASGNSTASSEFWNGTSWTETADTAGSGQRFNMGGGTTVAGIIGKCSGPTPQAKSTEEFNCDNGLLTINVS